MLHWRKKKTYWGAKCTVWLPSCNIYHLRTFWDPFTPFHPFVKCSNITSKAWMCRLGSRWMCMCGSSSTSYEKTRCWAGHVFLRCCAAKFVDILPFSYSPLTTRRRPVCFFCLRCPGFGFPKKLRSLLFELTHWCTRDIEQCVICPPRKAP